MTELRMIDAMGYGIHRMYTGQAKRYFPMPDYDLSEENVVKVVLYGGIVDIAYSRTLIQKTDLSIQEICALDRVQKKLPLSDQEMILLRKKKLIEGRKPNLHVSASVASVTATKADYIRTRAQDDMFYIKLVIDYLQKFKEASRLELEKLLLNKLSDSLSLQQKKGKISYLITKMRNSGEIQNLGSDRKPRWRLR